MALIACPECGHVFSKTKKDGTVTTTQGAIVLAVALCRENAKRFVRNARILLNAGGSDGLAYVLWSFGIEEFGKGVLLDRQLQAAGASATETIDMKLAWRHEDKFQAGFDCLSELKSNIKFDRVLRVQRNQQSEDSVHKDPLQPDMTAAVPAGGTGLFSDGLGGATGVDATVKLRLDLLYVDWNQSLEQWARPGEAIRNPELEARWELKHDDLLVAIDALEHLVEHAGT